MPKSRSRGRRRLRPAGRSCRVNASARSPSSVLTPARRSRPPRPPLRIRFLGCVHRDLHSSFASGRPPSSIGALFATTPRSAADHTALTSGTAQCLHRYGFVEGVGEYGKGAFQMPRTHPPYAPEYRDCRFLVASELRSRSVADLMAAGKGDGGGARDAAARGTGATWF